jgi:hypothetical protein
VLPKLSAQTFLDVSVELKTGLAADLVLITSIRKLLILQTVLATQSRLFLTTSTQEMLESRGPVLRLLWSQLRARPLAFRRQLYSLTCALIKFVCPAGGFALLLTPKVGVFKCFLKSTSFCLLLAFQK